MKNGLKPMRSRIFARTISLALLFTFLQSNLAQFTLGMENPASSDHVQIQIQDQAEPLEPIQQAEPQEPIQQAELQEQIQQAELQEQIQEEQIQAAEAAPELVMTINDRREIFTGMLIGLITGKTIGFLAPLIAGAVCLDMGQPPYITLPLTLSAIPGCYIGAVTGRNIGARIATNHVMARIQERAREMRSLLGIDFHTSLAELQSNPDFAPVSRVGRVEVYATSNITVSDQLRQKMERFAAELNETFSDQESCPICLTEWSELRNPETHEVLLIKENCDCRFYFCANCNHELTLRQQNCPGCRGSNPTQRLILVMTENQETDETSLPAEAEELTSAEVSSEIP